MPANTLSTLSSIDTIMVFRGVIPCLVVIFIGYLVGRADRAEHEKTLSSLIYFVFSPCLIFLALHRHAFAPAEAAVLALAALLMVLLMLLPAWLLRHRRAGASSGYLLPILFTSTGTLLLPLAYLIYGNHGLAKAALFHLVSSLLFYTFGTWLGGEGPQPWRFFRSPSFYAAIAGVASVELAMPLPDALEGFFRLVERGIEIVGIGAVPMLLLSFGYPFCQIDRKSLYRGISGGALRMLGGPVAALLAVLVCRAVGLLSTAKGYAILEFIDMRTTEAVILLAGATPGAISCYLFNRRHDPAGASEALAMLMAASFIGIITIPAVLLLIDRCILSG